MTSRDLFWYFKEELPEWDVCYNLEWLLRGAVTPFKQNGYLARREKREIRQSKAQHLLSVYFVLDSILYPLTHLI